jgi:hypothetical protein
MYRSELKYCFGSAWAVEGALQFVVSAVEQPEYVKVALMPGHSARRYNIADLAQGTLTETLKRKLSQISENSPITFWNISHDPLSV